jgi:hypothetical protein
VRPFVLFEVDESNSHGGHPLFAADEPDAFVGRRFDPDLIDLDAEGLGDFLLHLGEMGGNFGPFSDEGGIDIEDGGPFFVSELLDFFKEDETAAAFPLGIGVREIVTDISLAHRSQKGIGNCVNEDIGIGVAIEALFKGDFDPAEKQFTSGDQLVNIISHSNAIHKYLAKPFSEEGKKAGKRFLSKGERDSGIETGIGFFQPSCVPKRIFLYERLQLVQNLSQNLIGPHRGIDLGRQIIAVKIEDWTGFGLVNRQAIANDFFVRIIEAVILEGAALETLDELRLIGTVQMKNMLHVELIGHLVSLAHVARNPIEDKAIDFWFETAEGLLIFDMVGPKLDREIIRDELTAAGVFKERFPEIGSEIE